MAIKFKKKRATLRYYKKEVADFCGVSVRILQYWCEKECVDLKTLSFKDIIGWVLGHQKDNARLLNDKKE